MIILKNNAVVNEQGTVYMFLDQPNDLYSLFSCISKGDTISTPFVINKKTSSVETLIDIYVKSAEYDYKNSVIHIYGSLVSQIAFRSFEIKQNSPCKLTKTTWSNSDLDSLLKSSDDSDLAVVLIPKKGVADIFLATKTGWPKVWAKIKQEFLAVDTETSFYYDWFFGSILTAFHEHVDFQMIKHVVIAGPGGLKDKFYSYLFSVAKKLKLKSILDNKSRFLLVPTESRNFKEILEMEAIKKFVKRTDEHSDIMDKLDFLNATDADRACYGWKSVEIANKLAAIRTLLVREDLIRSPNIDTRKKYAELVESVEKYGGTTEVLCCDQDSGKRLGVLTGVAAILHFPVLNLDDIEL